MRLVDVRLLLSVCAAQVLLAAALQVASVCAIRGGIARWRGVAQRAAGRGDRRTSQAIEAVGRRLPRISTCLVRALTAELLLARGKAAEEIVIGVRRSSAGALESHAWFEQAGLILVGAEGADQYRPIARFTAVERPR